MALPEQLGRLRRVRRIGAGGFASVWLYRDEELDSPVAVKVLADNWAQDPDIRTRFIEESRLLRRAGSDHVVAVHDVGVTEDDVPFFVMTYADLGSAADLLAAGRRPSPAELVDVVGQAARGLADLHAQGIVHRDVKPANLLFVSRPDGSRRVLVADLGVAKALTTESGATLHVGTPAYGAPEQGDPSAPLDARADVHGLGAVAWALVAGAPPRRGPDGTLPPLGDLRPRRPRRRRPGDPHGDGAGPGAPLAGRAVLRPGAGRGGARRLTAARSPRRPTPPPVTAGPADARRRATRRTAVVVGGALVAVAAVVLLAVRPFGGGGSGGDGTVNGYQVAAERFLTSLQERDCDTAGSMLGMPEGWDCADPPADEFHWAETADWVDPDAETRVEDLGDGVFRVVFIDQGYVLVKQRPNSTMAVEGLVGGLEQDPDGRSTPPPG